LLCLPVVTIRPTDSVIKKIVSGRRIRHFAPLTGDREEGNLVFPCFEVKTAEKENWFFHFLFAMQTCLSYMEKLESAGYLKVKRSFKGKVRNTSYQLTQKGSKALAQYWEKLDAVRLSGQP